jgi:dihydrodipicolinate synthase/N-acetylneuraminate lyase
VLVAGTMGLMPMLLDSTYRQLVERAVLMSKGKGEVLVGASDTSVARTRERIQFLNEFQIAGAVVLTPYFLSFNQSELEFYFATLADLSCNPIYLYDSPGLTGNRVENGTVLRLARHPNIRGIKCVGDLASARQLRDAAPSHFRVVFAQADLIDVLLKHGIREHLDGIFSLAPFWVSGIEKAAAEKNWELAAKRQQQLSELLRVVKKYGVFQSFTYLLNMRHIPGNYAPAPMRRLSDTERSGLSSEPIVQQLMSDSKNAAAQVDRTVSVETQPVVK